VEYSDTGYFGSVRGADWIIDGQRWREVCQVPTPEGIDERAEYFRMIRIGE